MTINTVLGGMMVPRVPPAAMEPVLNVSLYLYFRSSDKAMVPMVAAVADVEPEMEANPAQAKMVVEARPPRNRPTHL